MDRRRFLEISAFSIFFSGCGGHSASNLAPAPIPPVSSNVAASEWQQLTADLTGKLTLPNQGSVYQKARLVFSTRFDHIYPEAIVHCANEVDIITALSFVQRNNLHVTSRCGGHGYTGNSTTTGLVLDLTLLNTITISNGTVTIGGGARLVDVYDQLTARGVAIPLGSCLSVGISGLTLGGGIGVVDRAYGLTCDNLLSAEVITADGTKVTCSATQEPDLYWALRGGGGGNFAIVSNFTFKTHATKDITVFEASYAFADFEAVMAQWQTLSQAWPNEMWAQVIPNWMNSTATVSIRAFCLNTVAQARPYWQLFINSINAVANSTSVSTNTYRNVMLGTCENTIAACHLSSQFPQGTMPRSAFAASSDFFHQTVPPLGIQTLKTFIEESIANSNLGMIIFNTMGGAIDELSQSDTAFIHRNALFSAEYYTYLPTNSSNDTIDQSQKWQNSFRDVMAPWSSGGAYVNYLDAYIEDWQQAYYGDNYTKLAQVKRKYDQDRIFTMLQGVEPA
ncbi:MAG: FAD-binding oxidoreductase [Colwellia sp.]|nr:FAD-binding oxidoreductase [Colwellia sp.]